MADPARQFGDDAFAVARRNMVECQLRPNRVTEPGIVDAFLSLPRERFVPDARQSLAYLDEDLPLGEGRYLTEPMVLARLIQEASPAASDVALVVGAGTGYSTAVLSRLVTAVIGLEANEALASHADSVLSLVEADNAAIVVGELDKGWARQAPYDLILIDGAVASVPPALLKQLAEGGRLLTVIRPADGVGEAMLMRRLAGQDSWRPLFDAATPWLPGLQPRPTFVF